MVALDNLRGGLALHLEARIDGVSRCTLAAVAPKAEIGAFQTLARRLARPRLWLRVERESSSPCG